MGRSEVMSRVRGKDTKPEMRVRRFLHAAGLRYRTNVRTLPGRPDIVFASRRIAIFVHGCFWHRHAGCAATRMPKTRVDFWSAKFAGNVTRDERSLESLRSQGWSIIVIWECETEDAAVLNRLANRIHDTEKTGRTWSRSTKAELEWKVAA
jgi:DNA mismatch endonuclease (patch repair protein)